MNRILASLIAAAAIAAPTAAIADVGSAPCPSENPAVQRVCDEASLADEAIHAAMEAVLEAEYATESLELAEYEARVNLAQAKAEYAAEASPENFSKIIEWQVALNEARAGLTQMDDEAEAMADAVEDAIAHREAIDPTDPEQVAKAQAEIDVESIQAAIAGVQGYADELAAMDFTIRVEMAQAKAQQAADPTPENFAKIIALQNELHALRAEAASIAAEMELLSGELEAAEAHLESFYAPEPE